MLSGFSFPSTTFLSADAKTESAGNKGVLAGYESSPTFSKGTEEFFFLADDAI
jgi:hypothetical protein